MWVSFRLLCLLRTARLSGFLLPVAFGFTTPPPLPLIPLFAVRACVDRRRRRRRRCRLRFCAWVGCGALSRHRRILCAPVSAVIRALFLLQRLPTRICISSSLWSIGVNGKFKRKHLWLPAVRVVASLFALLRAEEQSVSLLPCVKHRWKKETKEAPVSTYCCVCFVNFLLLFRF